MGIDNNWGHHPKPPDWKNWLSRPLVERCAHHWTYINEHGFARVADRACLVRFEDMIRDPRSFARNVCEHLGLTPGHHTDSLQTWVDRVQDTNNQHFREAETSRNYSRPDHVVRVGRWRENLSMEEARMASGIVAHANRRFGYDLSGLGE